MVPIAMGAHRTPGVSCSGDGESQPLAGRERHLSEAALRVDRLAVAQWGAHRAVSIVGRHPLLLEALAKAEKIAAFGEPVLVTGESGSGKESLAEAIYLLGPRRGKPFVAVNCPQFQEGNLTVSELFGHRRGSFTGAVADRRGCFEVADGGVIFLDEIGDLPMGAQVMLLRALATGEFQPLGDTRTRRVNVRVVAASNRPLARLGVGDQFRHDLFFRLRYFHIAVPPLRERGDDWQLLLEYFLARLCARHGVVKSFSPSALSILSTYDWPGNVRELESVVTMGYALCDRNLIEPNDFVTLFEERQAPAGEVEEDLYRQVVVSGADFWRTVHHRFLERDLNRAQVRAFVRRALIAAGGSYRRLVEHLGLPAADYQRLMDFLRHHRLKP